MEEINPKIILIILKTYFKDLSFLVTEPDILNYYYTLINYVRSDQEISWNELGSDYIVFNMFKHVNPSDIIINMENMYTNIIEILNLNSPNIVINPIDLATILSNNDVDKFSYYLNKITNEK